ARAVGARAGRAGHGSAWAVGPRAGGDGVRLIRRLSIRVRLTVGTLIIAGVFFAGTAVVVHRQVDSILRSSSVMLLQGDLAQYQQEIADGRTSNLDTPAQGQLVAVIDPSGQVMQSSLPAELGPNLGVLAAAGSAVQDVRTPAARYLVLARQIPTVDGTWSVVTARNEAASALSLDNLTRALAWGLVILTLLFGVGSWLLASAALRPVAAMRRTAERLRGTASVELLPVGPAHDELFYLANTLNDLITQLRASADREKQLVSDASHELRTPIAILQTQLELAHLSTGDQAALLGEIESAERTVQRLSALAASLLELTRIEGMTARETTTFDDLAEELADAIDRARLVSIGSGILVDYDVGEHEEVAPFELSRRNFGRIVDNLLGNAIVAMNEATVNGVPVKGDPSVGGHPGTVRASLACSARALTLEITDTGPGMAPEFLPLAFDRFAREDESRGGTRPGSVGAGLGLSIVQALVTSAGGAVTITNRRPRGLSVIATIPVSTGALSTSPASTSPASTNPTAGTASADPGAAAAPSQEHTA
ncbi:MAG: two-component system, OmpR family, sensor kinase, partial [Subtercola sp.]|nr:two-component system, OmpR family, sensor kinase [Subtercola sp.]